MPDHPSPVYPGIDGFLGTRASLMLDVVFLAMFAVLPLLGWSVWLVKYRRRFLLHKRVQLVPGAVLLVAVGLFEADMRINGWRLGRRTGRRSGQGHQGPDRDCVRRNQVGHGPDMALF